MMNTTPEERLYIEVYLQEYARSRDFNNPPCANAQAHDAAEKAVENMRKVFK